MWYVSSDVEVGGSSIGQIRSRRLADGRIEMGFRAANGEAFSPDILFLPAERPEGVWFRSGEIEVPPTPEPVAEEEEASESPSSGFGCELALSGRHNGKGRPVWAGPSGRWVAGGAGPA